MRELGRSGAAMKFGWMGAVALGIGFLAGACNDEQVAADTGVADTGVADTGGAEATVVADTGAPVDTAVVTETVVSDTGVAETVVSDTVVAEATVSDTVVSDSTPDGSETSIAACTAGDDCTVCTYGTAPKTVADCYCPLCPHVPMPTATCQANADAWAAVCGEWSPGPIGCPRPMCMRPEPVACIEGQCQSACAEAVCPALGCPASEQTKLPGDCCPSCTGDTRCFGDEDCQNCLYPTAPASAADCYCKVCADATLPVSVCLANEKKWNDFCATWQPPDGNGCPAVRCANRTAPVCDRYGQCVANPNGCRIADDCGSCNVGGPPPQNPAECRCPMCPVPLADAECTAIHTAMSTVCADFDYASCPIPPCVPPPGPITCREDTLMCGYDFSGSP